mmetsp:Transcript_19040/g.44038  ORF Transcript_19040/g.44038 Transcript_19040/m.44038 type:complete len:402 (-) Transcript_19040:429-1634(-)
MPGGHEGGDSEPVETGTGTNAAASGALSVRSQSAGGPLVPETVLGLAPGPDSSDRSPVAPRLPQPARANGRGRQGGRLLSNPIDRVRGIQADRKTPGPDRGRSAQRDGAENAPPPKTVDQGRPPLRAHAQGIRNSRRHLEALPPRPGRPLPLQQPPRGRPQVRHHLSGGRPPGGRRGQQVPKGPPRNVQQAGHAENTLLCQHAQDRGLLLLFGGQALPDPGGAQVGGGRRQVHRPRRRTLDQAKAPNVPWTVRLWLRQLPDGLHHRGQGGKTPRLERLCRKRPPQGIPGTLRPGGRQPPHGRLRGPAHQLCRALHVRAGPVGRVRREGRTDREARGEAHLQRIRGSGPEDSKRDGFLAAGPVPRKTGDDPWGGGGGGATTQAFERIKPANARGNGGPDERR